MRFFLIIILYFFALENHFSQDSSSDWEEIVEKAYSSDSKERKEAVDKLILAKDKASIALLRNRLLIETNGNIIQKIFNFFEIRNSRDDFFHLVKFLEVSRSLSYSIRCMKLLYRLDPKRLRSDLNKMFTSDELKIHSISFLKAVAKPTKEDKLFFYRQFRKHRMAKYWLSLHTRFDGEILLALRPYYKSNLFTERLSNYTLYWYLLYKKIRKEKISKQVVSKINLKIVESIPERRQAALLRALGSRIYSRIKFQEWFFADSFQVNLWLLKNYFHIKHRHLRGRYARLLKIWEAEFLKFLTQLPEQLTVKSLLLQKIGIFYLDLWSEKEKWAFNEMCQKTPMTKKIKTKKVKIRKETCFLFWLKTSPAAAVKEWEKLSPIFKRNFSDLYFRDMISLKEFQGSKNLRWFLSNKKLSLRYRLLKNLSVRVLVQNSDLFISFLETQASYKLKLLFLGYVKKHPKLKEVFSKYLPNFQYSL